MRLWADDNMVEQAVRVPLGADPRVLKVLGHPLRWKIFSRLGERAWSAVHLQAALGIPYEAVREHLRVLVGRGWLNRSVMNRALGGRRTLYRAERFYFTAEEWAELPADIRQER